MKINRIFAFLLALVMTASCMPIISVAADSTELLEMQEGESLTLNTISGSQLIAAEDNGNKFMQVQKIDYNGDEGVTVKINPAKVGNTTIKNYYIRFKVRVTNEELNGEASDERFVRLAAVSNVTAAYTYPTYFEHFSTQWVSSGYESKSTVGAGGWVYPNNNLIAVTLTNSATAGEFSLNINTSGKVSDAYAAVYADQAAYDADADKISKGRWRTDHDVAAPIEFDDIQIGYFTDDRSIASVKSSLNSKDYNASFTEENGFVIYTTIDFEDGTFVGKDASGNAAASVSPNNKKTGTNCDVDGPISLAVNTEADYNRVTDATAKNSGIITFDKPIATGIYTVKGDFRLAYFQNSGRRYKIGKTMYQTFDEGVHSGTIVVTNQNGDELTSFEIGPWWTASEVTFAVKDPIESLKFTLTNNGITEDGPYKNTVDIKHGLTLTMAESFTKTVEVGGDVIDSLDMYSIASQITVTDDSGNSFIHIGNRDFNKASDGVIISTGTALKANTAYTIALKARQPLEAEGDTVALNLMPLDSGVKVPGVRYNVAGKPTWEWARTHIDMKSVGLPYNVNGSYTGHEGHAGYGYGVVYGDWFTYLYNFTPAQDVKSLQLAFCTSYLSGSEPDRHQVGSSWKNKVNPIELDDIVIYESAHATEGKEIYQNDFEGGNLDMCKPSLSYAANSGYNVISLEGGEYSSLINENEPVSMILSGFGDLPAGKYQLSVDVRLGAYDGHLSYERNVAHLKMNPYLINPTLDNPKATLTGGKNIQLGGEWTTVTYSFEMKEDRVLEQLVLSLEGYGDGYIQDVSRLDFRNFQLVPDNYEAPKVPFNAALLLLIRRRNDEKGDGNFLRGTIAEDKLGNWETNGQTLEVKTEGDLTYLAASNIKNNYSGFTYTSDQVLKPGTYLFRFKVRTAVEGEDTQLRITFCGNDTKLRCGNEWTEFESIIDITEETPISFRFRGGPLAFYRQNVDIADLQLFDLRDLADGGSIIIGDNLFPQGDFEDPTVTYFWNGNPSEKNGWEAITVTRNSEEGNNFVTAGNRAVNYQNLDLDTGIIVEAGRTYNIRFRIRVNHGRNSGMRCTASAGGAWYKLKVGDEGSPDPNSSWYHSFAINSKWKYVDTTYVAETDGSLKIRFSGDTDAKSVQDIDIDDIEVYLMFVDN